MRWGPERVCPLYPHTDRDKHGDDYPNEHRNFDLHTNLDIDTNRHSDRYPHTLTNLHPDERTNRDTNGYADKHTFW
jgi:hypothetical protein